MTEQNDKLNLLRWSFNSARRYPFRWIFFIITLIILGIGGSMIYSGFKMDYEKGKKFRLESNGLKNRNKQNTQGGNR